MDDVNHCKPCNELFRRWGIRGFPYCSGCFAHIFLGLY